MYSNAYLTLVASHAQHSNDGLFLPRDVPKAFYTVQVPTDPETKQDNNLTFAFPAAPYARTVPDCGTLAKRAWCVQEIILSTRILTFTAGEVHWQCYGCITSETVFIFDWMSRYEHWSDALADWKSLVQRYSQRSITNVGDRLIAIQGLVNVAKELFLTAECHFGVWFEQQSTPASLSHWIHQLLWKRELPGNHFTDSQCRALKALSLLSWSWASLPATITYL